LANLFHPVHLGEDGDNGLVQEKQEVTSSTAATASSSTTTAYQKPIKAAEDCPS